MREIRIYHPLFADDFKAFQTALTTNVELNNLLSSIRELQGINYKQNYRTDLVDIDKRNRARNGESELIYQYQISLSDPNTVLPEGKFKLIFSQLKSDSGLTEEELADWNRLKNVIKNEVKEVINEMIKPINNRADDDDDDFDDDDEIENVKTDDEWD